MRGGAQVHSAKRGEESDERKPARPVRLGAGCAFRAISKALSRRRRRAARATRWVAGSITRCARKSNGSGNEREQGNAMSARTARERDAKDGRKGRYEELGVRRSEAERLLLGGNLVVEEDAARRWRRVRTSARAKDEDEDRTHSSCSQGSATGRRESVFDTATVGEQERGRATHSRPTCPRCRRRQSRRRRRGWSRASP